MEKKEEKTTQNQPKKIDITDTNLIKKAKKQKDSIYKKRIKKLEEEVQLYKDHLLRKAAEFDNYKKRTEKNIADIINNASENLIKELLPVVDDCERTISAMQNTEHCDTLNSAIEMIYNKLIKILEAKGLQPIEAVGKEFDANLHDAMMVKESKDKPENIILEEFEKGYSLNGKVIRHSKVVVSK